VQGTLPCLFQLASTLGLLCLSMTISRPQDLGIAQFDDHAPQIRPRHGCFVAKAKLVEEYAGIKEE
jgi:hypothetical protein